MRIMRITPSMLELTGISMLLLFICCWHPLSLPYKRSLLISFLSILFFSSSYSSSSILLIVSSSITPSSCFWYILIHLQTYTTLKTQLYWAPSINRRHASSSVLLRTPHSPWLSLFVLISIIPHTSPFIYLSIIFHRGLFPGSSISLLLLQVTLPAPSQPWPTWRISSPCFLALHCTLCTCLPIWMAWSLRSARSSSQAVCQLDLTQTRPIWLENQQRLVD